VIYVVNVNYTKFAAIITMLSGQQPGNKKSRAVLYKIHFKSISITKYKLHFQIVFQILFLITFEK